MPVVLNDKYILGRTLGVGGSCKVKLAKDEAGRRYAIKILHNDENALDQIDPELEALAQIPNHQNIVQFVEVNKGLQVNTSANKQKMVNYIVLELVSGGELFDFVSIGGRFTEAEGRYYFKQLLDGLHHIHSHGYAHRDMKCENILLDSNFTLKITDFGLAGKLAGSSNTGAMETACGTLSMMAPEIHMNMPYTGEKVDIFAAGIILFTIISQRPPFESASRTNPHYKLIASGSDQFWEAHRAAEEGKDIYSDEFKDLFTKIMNVSPKKRPTIQEIMDHPWMQLPFASEEEIKQVFAAKHALVEADAKKEREDKKGKIQEWQSVRRSGAEYSDEGAQAQGSELQQAWSTNDIREYGPEYQLCQTQFFTSCPPLDFFQFLTEQLEKQEIGPSISSSKLSLKFQADIGDKDQQESQMVIVSVEVLRVSDYKHCVKFTYLNPVGKTEVTGELKIAAIRHFMSYSFDSVNMFNNTTYAE